jgi:phage gp37-like protein
MITLTENAIVERLRLGLGKMAKEVNSYGGELEDMGAVVHILPAVWVTFLGVQGTKPVSTHRKKFYVTGRFSVMVACYNVREETARRQGGPMGINRDEPGSNLLIRSIRRLLTRQDFGLKIEPLMPGRVRNLFNSAMNHKALSAYACEFDTVWVEEALDNARWPAPESDADDDYAFQYYGGKLDKPWPMHESTGMAYRLPGQSGNAAEDIVETRNDE